MKNRTSKYAVTVEWGDCDPASIVFYPKYFAWFDAASHALIDPVWKNLGDLMASHNARATPLAEASAKFLRPSQYGQLITFESEISSWEERRFVIQHRGYRDGECLIEGKETRFIARPYPNDPARIQAITIPTEFKNAFLLS